MKRPWLVRGILGVLWSALSLNAAYAQEVPTPKQIEITLEAQAREVPEAAPATRSFEAKDLNELLSELLAYNPQLKAVIEKILTLESRIDPAGSLDDPRFSFEGSNIPISPPALNRTPMTGLQIYYRQKVPWPGKLKLKKKIALSKTEQEKQEYYERLNQLVAKFKKTFFDYLKVTELLSIYRSTNARLGGFGKILEARYSAGDTPQQDILKNKVEISNLQETIVALEQERKILLARMNTLLDRPAGTQLVIKSAPHERTALEVSLADLLTVATRHRPWLKKIDLQIQEAEIQHKLSKKSLLPDFDFAAGWRFRQNSTADPVNGEDFFSAGFSINLPVFAGKKQKKEIQAAEHQKRMHAYLKRATEQEVRYQVEQIYHQLQEFRSQLRISKRRSVPQAHAAVSSSRLNYEADEVDFLNVLTNEVALLNQRLKQARYRYEYEKKIAELEMATGLPIHLLNEWSFSTGESHENL